MSTKTQPFVHLHFHTEYSLLDGACKIDKAVAAAKEMGLPAVAITDHGVMFGAIDFYKQAKAADLNPIIGCEVYMAPEGTTMHEHKRGEDGSQSNHFVLLAKDATGYQNLIELVSKAHLEGFYYKPRIDKELLSRHNKGLIGMSACLKGVLAEKCVQDDIPGAVRAAHEYADILGRDNFYIELMDHGLKEQALANQRLAVVAKESGFPLVVSNDVHYLSRDHYEAHDVMLCLQTGAKRSDPGRMRYGSRELYMKTPEEMYRLFKDFPDALARTVEIAERCALKLNLGKELHFPVYTVPEGLTQRNYLVKIAKEGLFRRYGIEDLDYPKNPAEQQVKDRFYYELSVIEKTGFVNYFLVVWDFIRYAKDHGIPVGPGRGSGAGCMVAYALGITDLDPLRYNLIFERFLNPDRVSPPDFDIDFCQARRGEVIDYVKQKYGRENVAQIITFGTLGPKTVIRDLGRVLEFPLSDCDRLAKLVPEHPEMTLERALKESPDFKRACETEAFAKEIMKYAGVLEGLPRNPGTHAAGVVIGERPLHTILPLARDKDGEPVTQFEMKPIEQVGLLKMDFLGLRTLTVIQETLENIRKVHGITLTVEDIPYEDEATFALLGRAETVGVFQLESDGMQNLLRDLRLSRFEELIAMIALYRPGPMSMAPGFINRKHGRETIEYDHPLLESVLKETYGIMIYQEQVQQAANILAGYTLAQGDLLRRAMGKKNAAEMAAQRENFVKGCKATNGIEPGLAGRIFDNIEKFAGYGFNKSHSAAYAVTSWRTAYLKAHYPAEFMAACLTSEISNPDKLRLFISDAQQIGLAILPPSVNESDVNFTPVGKGIRFGLAGVKNVGVGVVENLVRERQERGPFKDLIDFCGRMNNQAANKKVLESLVTCGAFDFTGMTRGRMFNGIDFALARATDAQRDKASGQGSLFDMMETKVSTQPSVNALPEAPAWPASKMLLGEKELLGFYVSGHPLQDFTWTIQHCTTAAFAELPNKIEQVVRLAGMVTGFAKRFTKQKQEAMGSFRLESLDGTLEAVAFPNAFEQYGVYLKEDAPVLVAGKIGRRQDNLQITVDEVFPLAEAARHFVEKITLHVPVDEHTTSTLENVRTALQRSPGETEVEVCLQFPDGALVEIRAGRICRITASSALLSHLQKLLGPDRVNPVVFSGTYRYPERFKKRYGEQRAKFGAE